MCKCIKLCSSAHLHTPRYRHGRKRALGRYGRRCKESRSNLFTQDGYDAAAVVDRHLFFCTLLLVTWRMHQVLDEVGCRILHGPVLVFPAPVSPTASEGTHVSLLLYSALVLLRTLALRVSLHHSRDVSLTVLHLSTLELGYFNSIRFCLMHLNCASIACSYLCRFCKIQFL